MSTQRTIKFRAWTGTKMIEGVGFSVWNGFVWDDEADCQLPWILMQYTGLKDKEGREIYEGDIIEAYGKNATVLYADIRAMYIAHDTWNEALVNVANACTVIGNIYENPELIEA